MVLGTLLKHSVLILVTVTIFRYLIFPFLLELVLQVRIRSVSPRSIRGIEWSSKRNGCKELSPRLKLERIGLQKSKRKGGLLTISIEGLTIYLTRVAEDNQSDSDHDVKPDHSTATKRDRKRRGSSGSAISFVDKVVNVLKERGRKWTIFYTSLAVQQSPWLAHLVDLQIQDVRLIYKSHKTPSVELFLSSFNACFDVAFDEAPELIKPTFEHVSQITAPSLPSSPFSEPRSPVLDASSPPDTPAFVMNNGLLSPPPSFAELRKQSQTSAQPVPGLRKSRPAKILSRLLGRARGSATFTVEMGPCHLSDSSEDKVLECVDKTKSEVTVQFGDKSGIMGEDTIDVKLQVSPLSFSVPRILGLSRQLKADLPKHKPQKTDSGPSPKAKEIVNALHHVHLALPYTTAQFELGSNNGQYDFSVNGCFLDVSSISPARHPRYRDIFGHNEEAHAIVKGLGFSVTVEEVRATWHQEGQPLRKLMNVGPLDLRGFSTWKPKKWQRPQMLFDGERNLSMIDVLFTIERMHVNTSIPMIAKIKGSLPEKGDSGEKLSVSTPIWAEDVPKIHFHTELGHSSACLFSDDSKKASLVEFGTGGMTANFETDFRDICATHHPRTGPEIIPGTGASMPGTGTPFYQSDYLTGESALSNREFTFETGSLRDDISVGLDWQLSIRTHHATLAVSSANSTVDAQEIIRLGPALMTGQGTIHGGQQTLDEQGRTALWPDTGHGEINFAIENFAKISLWQAEAQTNLLALMTAAQKFSVASDSQTTKTWRPLLSQLPSGIRIRVALPKLSILLASSDPNPDCKAKIQRGLQMRLSVVIDFCMFEDVRQMRPSKLDVHPKFRRKLRLGADATEQAIALHNETKRSDALAAHLMLSTRQIVIAPVYNAVESSEDFTRPTVRPLSGDSSKTFFPQRTRFPSYAGWDFQRMRDQPKPASELSNSMDPFALTPSRQSVKPLLSLKKVEGSFNIQELFAEKRRFVAGTLRAAKAKMSGDLSHIYCGLLAVHAIPRPRPAQDTQSHQAYTNGEGRRSASNLRIKLNLDECQSDFALPLKERIFFDIRSLSIETIGKSIETKVESVMFFVPSPRAPGRWEEFGRLRRLDLRVDINDKHRPSVHLDLVALRIRIPFRYEPSKLILNINVMLKAIKLLVRDLHTTNFRKVQKPYAQKAKNVPNISIGVQDMTFEIKDDPLETKLNLIWRVGLNEQADRLERLEAFAAKVAVVEASRDNGYDEQVVNDLKEQWGFDANASRSVHDAAYNLAWYSAQAWKNRFDKALQTQNKRETSILTKMYGSNRARQEDLPIEILPPERFAPLFRARFHKLRLDIQNPNMSQEEICDHMEGLAGQFPEGQQFSLLVPLQIGLTAESVDLTLRDYPMPLFQIRGQEGPDAQVNENNLEAKMTMIIGEELAAEDSFTLLSCPVLPEKLGSDQDTGLTMVIAKTMMPVKTYCKVAMKVATDVPTDFTWGNSYQPAIEDLVKALGNFTHPPADPSPKVGFWDKFRLTLHWRITVDFAGPCHLHLKGSRDPYHVTGFGAGFVLAWTGNVKLQVGEENEQKELIQMSSDEMFFCIPDLTAMIDNAATGSHQNHHSEAGKSPAQLPTLLERPGTKSCARFVGGVRVGFGFKFERTCRDHNCARGCRGDLSERKCRFFDFKPHHEVILRSRQAVNEESQKLERTVDSFEGFRSDFIHFSPSISTFGKPMPSASEAKPDLNRSSFHFTPKGFTHFFAWWRLFNHVMNLPIRQGKLFPKAPPPHRKFGRSLATIKYRFDISNLFISHLYPQMNKTDWSTGRDTSLGIKAQIKHFQADLHQREQTKIIRKEALNRLGTIKHKPFYAADIILDGVRLRALSAVFDNQSRSFLEKVAPISSMPEPEGVRVNELSKQDAPWFHYDDYVDADARPSDSNPYIVMYEVGECPQFHYSRWIPALKLREGVIDKMKKGHWFGTDLEASKFGREPSHRCLLGEHPGSNIMGRRLLQHRLSQLEEELGALPTGNGENDHHESDLSKAAKEKRRSLQAGIHGLKERLASLETDIAKERESRRSSTSADHIDSREVETEGNDFQNVYQIYLPRIMMNNQSRNILLKYYYSSRLRKGLEYYLSNKALKSMREQLENINDKPHKAQKPKTVPKNMPNKLDWVAESSGNVVAKELLKLVLGDPSKEQDVGNNEQEGHRASAPEDLDPHAGLPDKYSVAKSHYLLLMGPQLALSSEVDRDSTILFAMETASFKGYTVTDDDFVGDAVNSRLMHRNYSDLRGLQGFYPCRSLEERKKSDNLFVPPEVLLDAKCQSADFDRVFPKTDAQFHYDKFNQLRLSNDLSADRETQAQAIPEHIQHKQDLAVLHIPRIAVMANSQHYSALYNVVTNLVLYQDPEQRQRSQKMDTFVYSFDRRDAFRYVSEAARLQYRIRELESLVRAYDENYDHLTSEGKLGLIDLRADLLNSVETLNVIYEAVSIHQNHSEQAAALKASIRLEAHAGEVAWYMFGPDALLAKLAIKGINFSWLRKKDSSTDSSLMVDDLQALNSSPDAIFPEMLSKYYKSNNKQHKPIINVKWAVLAPVGGIAIIERIYVQLHPLRVQLEKRIGRQIMDYVFSARPKRKSQVQGKPANNGGNPHGLSIGDDDNSVIDFSVTGRESSKQTQDKRASTSRQGSSEHPPADPSSHRTLRKRKSVSSLSPEVDQAVHQIEADEMHSRATSNRTFVSIEIAQTNLVLSYKGDKTKSLTDLYDFKFTSPELQYLNKTWSFENVVQQMKKDIIRSAWQQKGALIKEVFKMNRVPGKNSHHPPSFTPMDLHKENVPAVGPHLNRSISHSSRDQKAEQRLLEDFPLSQSPQEEVELAALEHTSSRLSARTSHLKDVPAVDIEKGTGKFGKFVNRMKGRGATTHE